MRTPYDSIRPFEPAPWTADALCAQSGDPDAWFPSPTDRQGLAYAQKICRRCPVVELCAEAGKDEPHGIWGGQSAHARATSSTSKPRYKWGTAPCGTRSAFRRHQYRGETPCAACKEAENRYRRERRRKKAS